MNGEWDTTPEELFAGMLPGGVDSTGLPVTEDSEELFSIMAKNPEPDEETKRRCQELIYTRGAAIRRAKEYTDCEGDHTKTPMRLYDFMGWGDSMTVRERYRKRRAAEAKKPQRKYTEKEIFDAVKLMQAGMTYAAVERELDINVNTLKRIWRGERHRKLTGFPWNPDRESPSCELKARKREAKNALGHFGVSD